MPEQNLIEAPFRGKDLSGQIFGRLTVLGIAEFRRDPLKPVPRIVIWDCLCECGRHVYLESYLFKSGNTSSCGCLHKEQLVARSLTHGKSKHPLYERWQGMWQRCVNPHNRGWKWYGAKGVKVCERWKSFANFLADMEPSFTEGMTLERKNNAGDYEPNNVIWATWEQQRKNKTSH